MVRRLSSLEYRMCFVVRISASAKKQKIYAGHYFANNTAFWEVTLCNLVQRTLLSRHTRQYSPSCWICGRQSGTGILISPRSRLSSVSTIPATFSARISFIQPKNIYNLRNRERSKIKIRHIWRHTLLLAPWELQNSHNKISYIVTLESWTSKTKPRCFYRSIQK